MKKLLLLVSVTFFAFSLAIGQPYVKTFVNPDDTLSKFYQDDPANVWSWDSCAVGSEGIDFPLFSIDLATYAKNDTLGGIYAWFTDIKFDTAYDKAFDYEKVKSKLFVSFWANAFDGVNKNDTNAVRFEMVSGTGTGWPAVKFVLKSGWNWVSLDLSNVAFNGGVLAKDMSGVTILKMAIASVNNYYTGADAGKFKLAIQTLTISNGAAVKPAKAPCELKVGISTKEVSNAFVYPNPASNNIKLNVEGTFDVQIVNLVGQTVKSLVNVTSSTSIDISDLNNGVYFVNTPAGTSKLIVE